MGNQKLEKNVLWELGSRNHVFSSPTYFYYRVNNISFIFSSFDEHVGGKNENKLNHVCCMPVIKCTKHAFSINCS